MALRLPDEIKEQMVQTWETAEELEATPQGAHGGGRAFHGAWGGNAISFRIVGVEPRLPLIELADHE